MTSQTDTDTVEAPALGSLEDKLIHKLDTSSLYRTRARLALAFRRAYPDRDERIARLRKIAKEWHPHMSPFRRAELEVQDYLSASHVEAMYS